MKIKLDVPLKDLANHTLSDNEKEPLTVGKIVGNILCGEMTEIKPMKAWLLAQKFYGNPEIELDKDDLNKVIAAVEKSQKWLPLVTGQIVEYLTDQKD